MKLGRRLVAVAGALALTTGLAMATTPAHAATTAPAPTLNFTVENFSHPTHPRYGDYISVHAEVEAPTSGEYFIESGTVSIQVAPVGSQAWTTVASDSTFAYYTVEGIKAPEQFRAVFSGGSGTYYPPSGDSTTVTYPAVTSNTVAISSLDRGEAVAKQTAHKVCYKIGPAPYKNKPILYYAKVGKSKKWRFDGSVRTNKKSEYCFKIRHTKVKKHVKYKGPKIKAFKTVYVKSGGMKKSVIIDKF